MDWQSGASTQEVHLFGVAIARSRPTIGDMRTKAGGVGRIRVDGDARDLREAFLDAVFQRGGGQLDEGNREIALITQCRKPECGADWRTRTSWQLMRSS